MVDVQIMTSSNRRMHSDAAENQKSSNSPKNLKNLSPLTSAAPSNGNSVASGDVSSTEQHGQWVVSRKVDTHVDKKVYRTERVQRRILPEAEWRASFQQNPAAVLIDRGDSEGSNDKKFVLGSLTQPVQETRTTARNLNYHPASSADVYITSKDEKGSSQSAEQHAYRARRDDKHATDLDLGDAESRDVDAAACTSVSNDMVVVDEDGRLVRRNTSQVTQQEVTTVTRVYRTLEPVAAGYQLKPSFDYGSQIDGNNGDGSQRFEEHYDSAENVYPPAAGQQRHQFYDSQFERHPQQQYQPQQQGPNYIMHPRSNNTATNQMTDVYGTDVNFANSGSAPDVATEADILYAARYNYEHYRTDAASNANQHGDVVDFAAPYPYQRAQPSEFTEEPEYARVRPLLPPKTRTKTSYENSSVAAAVTRVDDVACNDVEERCYDSVIPSHHDTRQLQQQQQSGGAVGGSPAAFHHHPSALVDIGYEYDYIANDYAALNHQQPIARNLMCEEQNGLVEQPHPIFAEQQQMPPQSPPRPIALRDPELPEVVQFLCHWNAVVRANAAAHLAHLCYMNDAVKAQARSLGVIPLLIDLLAVADVPELHKNACCALRNLTYGRANDDNKRAFLYAGGVPALARLYSQISTSPQQQQRGNGRVAAGGCGAVELREAASATLWNLSSCDELKSAIIDEALPAFLNSITDLPIAAASALQQKPSVNDSSAVVQQQNLHYYNHQLSRMFHTAVFRNVSGVLRNVSSDGQHARQALRNGGTLLRALFAYLRMAVGEQDVDNKSTENCVCTVRNLAYRLQEIDDPIYDQQFFSGVGEIIYASPTTSTGTPSKTLAAVSGSSGKRQAVENGRHRSRSGSDEVGGQDITCFSTPRPKQKNGKNSSKASTSSPSTNASTPATPVPAATPSALARQVDILWSNDAVKCYLAILQHCANPDTLEAAAGVIQNLTACSWQPSLHVRGLVRKDKGLPILVELLRMENDRVVCSVARALRNLALDEKNRDLIGKYAMNDLISKIPVSAKSPAGQQQQQQQASSDETNAAILATCNECTASNSEFARVFVENHGLAKLIGITQRHAEFGPKTVRFATHVLHTLWRRHSGLHELYKSAGFKEAQLLFMPPGYSESSVNTLHRPFSSQGARRDDDETSGGAAGGAKSGPTTSAKTRQQVPSLAAGQQHLVAGQKQLPRANDRQAHGLDQQHQQTVVNVVGDPTRHSDSWV